MSNFLFPVKSNSRKEGAITIEDFKPLVKKESVKADLTFKEGRYKLSNKFLSGRDSLTGFTAVLSEDLTEAYILKSTNEDTFEKTIFVKGETAVNSFTSDALTFVLEKVGLSAEKGLYLNFVNESEGWAAYKLSTTPQENPAIVEPVAEQKEEDSMIISQDPDFNHAKKQEEGEVGQLAQQGVEELSFDENNIENLI